MRPSPILLLRRTDRVLFLVTHRARQILPCNTFHQLTTSRNHLMAHSLRSPICGMIGKRPWPFEPNAIKFQVADLSINNVVDCMTTCRASPSCQSMTFTHNNWRASNVEYLCRMYYQTMESISDDSWLEDDNNHYTVAYDRMCTFPHDGASLTLPAQEREPSKADPAGEMITYRPTPLIEPEHECRIPGRCWGKLPFVSATTPPALTATAAPALVNKRETSLRCGVEFDINLNDWTSSGGHDMDDEKRDVDLTDCLQSCKDHETCNYIAYGDDTRSCKLFNTQASPFNVTVSRRNVSPKSARLYDRDCEAISEPVQELPSGELVAKSQPVCNSVEWSFDPLDSYHTDHYQHNIGTSYMRECVDTCKRDDQCFSVAYSSELSECAMFEDSFADLDVYRDFDSTYAFYDQECRTDGW
ncbi:hypothetical protein K402DRAFT_263803 [Aulographum hederae CBS 113979]|uniref:Apple domain-containing protein n=1 Tax=Aulographum hederae CBS 113979 TaxID=1176131 RepID=A0A6G1H9S3_9PEZI|nr:hypothetical protein K402DRAFT_263803 [Aulographum hederae CBS 113979]